MQPLDLRGPDAVRSLSLQQQLIGPSLMAPMSTDQPVGDVTSDNAMILDTNGHFADTTREQLAAAFQSYRAQLESHRARLALFFHGGLVTIEGGRATASALIDHYRDAGCYPFFPIWDSGPFDILAKHWVAILESALFQTLLAHIQTAISAPSSQTTTHSFLALSQSDVGGRPSTATIKAGLSEVDKVALAIAVDNDPVVRDTVANLRSKSLVEHESLLAGADNALALEEYAYLDPRVVVRLLSEQQRNALLAESDSLGPITAGWLAVQVALRVIARYREGRSHPGLSTITEEIARSFFVGPFGEAMWDQMKTSIEEGLKAGDPAAGARALVEEIVAILRDKRGDVDITLLGHSAGAIYATRLLEEIDTALTGRNDDFAWNVDLVFFASALRIDHFAQSLERVRHRIAGFRSFELAEEFESADSILKYVGVPLPPLVLAAYPASLLYAISGVLEDDVPPVLGDEPLVGMQRYLGSSYEGSPTIESLRKFLGQQQLGVVLSANHPVGPPGCVSAATTHGFYPRDTTTIESTTVILKNGLAAPVGNAPLRDAAAAVSASLDAASVSPRPALLWGVDSSHRATRETLATATSRIAKPLFWGRYITYDRIWLDNDEVDFARTEGFRILPIYQRTTAHPGLLSGGTSGRQGMLDGAEAIARAKSYGIPQHSGIAIYADIEPTYRVSHYWLEEWINALTAGGYLAGIYCGSNQPGIRAGMKAVSNIDVSKVILWSCMPHDTTKTTRADVSTAFGSPGLQVGPEYCQLDMWQYCLDFEGFDFNVCTNRAFDAMWRP